MAQMVWRSAVVGSSAALQTALATGERSHRCKGRLVHTSGSEAHPLFQLPLAISRACVNCRAARVLMHMVRDIEPREILKRSAYLRFFYGGYVKGAQGRKES
ncbi:hypothetical protein B0F90DRAFT_501810 [Multifurca ochricompacta]|uniref:Uncharacterized protein n=1 Tax=Multifurca ochricompacta TaxID=376703 RepID=A0AAD4MBB0_9AGAM|nr:hypothetical protein B0F90DRAFT_501810 [Multifurca ochricompacta]